MKYPTNQRHANHATMDQPNRTHTLDDGTKASNPGRLQVNYFYWMRSFPQKSVWLAAALAIKTGFALLVNLLFCHSIFIFFQSNAALIAYLLIVLMVATNLAVWKAIAPLLGEVRWLILYTREFFLYGCINPAVVVATEPPLVAVFTDLRTNETPYHVIKILPQPLRWMKQGVPPVGTRLATIALYQGTMRKGHWDDFYPVVVNCVTGNQAEIDRILQSIPTWEWLELETGLIQLPRKPGLYRIF